MSSGARRGSRCPDRANIRIDQPPSSFRHSAYRPLPPDEAVLHGTTHNDACNGEGNRESPADRQDARPRTRRKVRGTHFGLCLVPKQAGYIIPNWPASHVIACKCEDVPSTLGAAQPLRLRRLFSASLTPVSALEGPQGSGHPDPDFMLQPRINISGSRGAARRAERRRLAMGSRTTIGRSASDRPAQSGRASG